MITTANLLSFASVMKTVGGVALAIVILLAMVTIHEFGHYVAGKILGFKINEFSVGFGPAIFKKRSKKTGEQFSLRIIPLGGYCAFDGEDDGEEPPKAEVSEKTEEPFAEMENDGGRDGITEETGAEPSEEKSVEKEEYPEPKGKRFNEQPPWKRIIVLIAGATMNYLLALALIVLMFACFGRPMYQIVKYEPKEEYQTPGAIQTYEEGLQTGDVILEIDGKKIYMITDYLDALNGKKKDEVVKILVLREGKKERVEVALIEDANPKNMTDTNCVFFSLGIAYREEIEQEDGTTALTVTRGGALKNYGLEEGFFQTIGSSFVYSFKIGGTVLRSLGELLTFKLGINAMGGPVTTITETAKVASNGFNDFLNIAAFIGVNLAVFNLLPVPALDGCKVVFCVIEWIRKKPINRKVEAIINFVGIIVLFGFAILVDILHFIL